MNDKSACEKCKWLQKELAQLAIESIEREKQLAKIEAEVIKLRELWVEMKGRE